MFSFGSEAVEIIKYKGLLGTVKNILSGFLTVVVEQHGTEQ